MSAPIVGGHLGGLAGVPCARAYPRPPPEPGCGGRAPAARTTLGGSTAPGFEPVADAFARLVGRHGRRGAGRAAARRDGGGPPGRAAPTGAARRPWTPDTVAISFSTTKGIASTVVHRLADRGELAYDARGRLLARVRRGRQGARHGPPPAHAPGRAARRPRGRRPGRGPARPPGDGGAPRRARGARADRALRLPRDHLRVAAGRAGPPRDRPGLAALAGTEVAEPLGITAGLHIGVPEEAREFVAEPVGSALRHAGSLVRVLAPAVDAPA